MIIVVFPGAEEVGGFREGLEFSVKHPIWLVPALCVEGISEAYLIAARNSMATVVSNCGDSCIEMTECGAFPSSHGQTS